MLKEEQIEKIINALKDLNPETIDHFLKQAETDPFVFISILAGDKFCLRQISKSIDCYIGHRIETDKVLEGILKDIHGSIAEMNQREEDRFNFEKSIID